MVLIGQGAWSAQRQQPRLHLNDRRETMKPEFRHLSVRHPEYGDGASFADVYRPLVRMTYHLREDRPRRIYVPTVNQTPRCCALCGMTEPEVTFKEDAHLIAAGVGNRSWFSREECDGCNHGFSSHEDELANMLSASRVIGRVRGRRGTAKVKAPGGLGSVGGGPFDGPVLLNVHTNDPSVRIDWSEDKKMKVTFPQPGYRPFDAIRSLVRSCWLGMTTEERSRHPYLLDFIAGALDPELNEYVDVMVYDGLYSHVMLEGWEPNPGRAQGAAPFVLRLCFVNRVLIWSSPEPSIRRHVPSPLPPVPLAFEIGSAEGKLWRGPSDARFEHGSVTHTVVYEERVRGTGETAAKARPKPIRLEADARLELETKKGTMVIGRTQQTISDLDPIDRRMTVRFGGHDLAGWIQIRSHGNTFDVVVGLDMTGHTTAECRQSHAFFRSLLNGGGELHARTATGTLTFPVQSSEVPYDDPEIDRLLDDLGIIESEFGVTLVLPGEITDDDARIGRFLATAIRDHRVATGDGDLSITLSPEAPDESVRRLDSGDSLAVETEEAFVIFGCHLPPLRYRTTFVAPKLIEPTIEEVFQRLRKGHEVLVRLSVAEIVHTFPLWESRAA
jgi:hypothetical protein